MRRYLMIPISIPSKRKSPDDNRLILTARFIGMTPVLAQHRDPAEIRQANQRCKQCRVLDAELTNLAQGTNSTLLWKHSAIINRFQGSWNMNLDRRKIPR